MSGRTGTRSWLVAGLAIGGVLAGHAITYSLLVPDPHTRSQTLAVSGHGYLAVGSRVGLLAVVGALLLVALAPVMHGRATAPPMREVRTRLAAFQVLAFVTIEVGERLWSGAPMHDLPGVLTTGLAIQALLAIAIASVVRVVLRSAEALVGSATPGTPVLRELRPVRPERSLTIPAASAILLPPGRAPPTL